ncbi:hypothetical protein JCM16303_007318 [Sporobolomyces ruberrimus]
MPPLPLLSSTTAQQDIQRYKNLMIRYRMERATGCPAESTVTWPPQGQLGAEWVEHLPNDGFELRQQLGVRMILDVGGPAGRILYHPSDANAVRATEHRNLVVYSRSETSKEAFDDSWTNAFESQARPILMPEGAELSTHVTLPRHVPVLLRPVSSRATKLNFNKSGLFSKVEHSHKIPCPDEKLTEVWKILRVQARAPFVGRVCRFDPVADGLPASPDVTYLRLDLVPSHGRHIDDHFSVLFRVRIMFHETAWVPWRPNVLLEGHELPLNETLDRTTNAIVRPEPLKVEDDRGSPAHALGHRQRKIYGQREAGGARRAF